MGSKPPRNGWAEIATELLGDPARDRWRTRLFRHNRRRQSTSHVVSSPSIEFRANLGFWVIIGGKTVYKEGAKEGDETKPLRRNWLRNWLWWNWLWRIGWSKLRRYGFKGEDEVKWGRGGETRDFFVDLGLGRQLSRNPNQTKPIKTNSKPRAQNKTKPIRNKIEVQTRKWNILIGWIFFMTWHA